MSLIEFELFVLPTALIGVFQRGEVGHHHVVEALGPEVPVEVAD